MSHVHAWLNTLTPHDVGMLSAVAVAFVGGVLATTFLSFYGPSR